MCGRYVSPDDAAIERHFKIDGRSPHPLQRRFNVAPSTTVPMLRLEDGALTLCAARWGLVPHWWKQTKPPPFAFNARSEEAASKPMWRHAYRNMRCLVPAEGWYEWQEVERVDTQTGEIQKFKQPHFIHRPDEPIFAFAGMMSWWTNSAGEQALSFAVMTTGAAPSVADVHIRMPVVLKPEQYEGWLTPEMTDPAAVTQMVADAQTEFEHHPVSTQVNNARNESAGLVERIVSPA